MYDLWRGALTDLSKGYDRHWKGQFFKENIIKLRKTFEELAEISPMSLATLFCLGQAYSRFDREIFPEVGKAKDCFDKVWNRFLGDFGLLSRRYGWDNFPHGIALKESTAPQLIKKWLWALPTLGNELLIIQQLDKAKNVYKECRKLHLLLDRNPIILDAFKRYSEKVEECSKCGYFDIRIMEKHHFKITRKQAYQTLREGGRFPLEFDSGNNMQVFCPNCHRKEHRARKTPLGKCLRCKNEETSVLVKHHIVPRSDGGSSKKDNLIVLCQNCHVLLHKLQYHLHTPDYFTPDELEKFIGGNDNLWEIIYSIDNPAAAATVK